MAQVIIATRKGLKEGAPQVEEFYKAFANGLLGLESMMALTEEECAEHEYALYTVNTETQEKVELGRSS